jgi:hypothetical protein
MGIIAALVLILLGLLSASGLVVGRRPGTEDLLAKIRPYQGWIGVVACVWGLFVIINAILIAAWLLPWAPVSWITYLLAGLLLAGLGFMLGYGLIQTHVLSKKPDAAAKGAQMLAKLPVYQVPMGIAAIVLGLWTLVSWFIWRF